MRISSVSIFILTLLVGNFLPESVWGQCISGNCLKGNGVFRFSSGAKYTGGFYDGKPHGQGTLDFTTGNRYVGEWQNGIREGSGTMTFKNGNVYEGNFRANKMDGQGTMRYQNLDKYTGAWKNDSPNGKGMYYFKSGELYEGDMVSGKFEGQGKMTYSKNSYYVGGWKDNRKHGKGMMVDNGVKENGVWENGTLVTNATASGGNGGVTSSTPATHSGAQNNTTVGGGGAAAASGKPDIGGLRNCASTYCRNGEGYYDYVDGSRYIGSFKDGLPGGTGRCYYANGDVYNGGWQENAPNGEGVMTFASGRVYGAVWLNGAPVREIDADQELPDVGPVNVVASKKVKIWALVVGVSRYEHMPLLKYTDDDAYQVFAFLKSPEGGALPDEQVDILIDESATRENILRSMKKMFSKADANDEIMLYFSGHGLEGCFLPVDFDGYNNKLNHRDILKIFEQSSAKYKFCVADACHSGSLQGQGLTAKGPVAVTLDKYYEAFENASGGTALLMSSKGEEVSLEDHGLRQGIFSHFLLKGLKGSADTNDDTIVTVRELFKYVHLKVREYTANAQTPILTGEFDDNMPVSIRRR